VEEEAGGQSEKMLLLSVLEEKGGRGGGGGRSGGTKRENATAQCPREEGWAKEELKENLDYFDWSINQV